MPIVKATAEGLISLGEDYEVLPRKVIQGLAMENTDALALWVYLMSLPKDWIAHRDATRKELGLSDRKYRAAIKVLKSKGIVTYKTTMSDGRATGSTLIVHPLPVIKDQGRTPVDTPEENEGTQGCSLQTCTPTDMSAIDIHKETDTNRETDIFKETECNRVTATVVADAKKTNFQKRLREKDLDEDLYPVTKEVLQRLHRSIANHESRGGKHNFALDRINRELTIKPEHLGDIESNLSRAMEIYADPESENDEYFQLTEWLLSLYRKKFQGTEYVTNLALLAGINLEMHGDIVTPEQYADWLEYEGHIG